MSQRLKEALTAGGPTSKDKGAPVPDGVLSVTPDTPEAIEWRSRRSVIDSIASSSSYLDDEDEGARRGGGGGLRRRVGGRAGGAPAACPALVLALSSAHQRPLLLMDAGPQSTDLYGKFTWKIEKFSEVSKRELRSHTFEVGSYKWCVAGACRGGRARAPSPAAALRILAVSGVEEQRASTKDGPGFVPHLGDAGWAALG